MRTITKLAVPAALAALTFGAQAQTIETHYPAVLADGNVVVKAAPVAGEAANAPLYLVQSNIEGPKADPAQIAHNAKSRNEVRADASVNVRWTPADMRGIQGRS